MTFFSQFFKNAIINHYNHTFEYYYMNPETTKYEMANYKEPVNQIILTDVLTIGFYFYLLNNL